MIAEPIVRYLLIVALAVLLLISWRSFRAQFFGYDTVEDVIARLRDSWGRQRR